MKYLFALLFIVHVSATTYYVRTDGSDNKNGQSEANAWASVDQVRSHAWSPGFSGGDSILFKGGETFQTSQGIYIQTDKSTSSAAAPITFSSYGTGRATIQAHACDGILVWAPSSGTTDLGLRVTDLNFQGSDVCKPDTSSAVGILVWNSSASDLGLIHVEDCEFSHFGGDGIATGRDDKTKGRLNNVVVRNVVSHDNPGSALISPHSGTGIVIAGADGALIEHCIAYNNGINNNNAGGPIGIWFWDCINSTIQFCEAYDNQTTRGDGGGFDLDGGCSNCVIQYCYSHGNAGAGYLLAQFGTAYQYYGPLENNTIRYNISENDGRKGSFGSVYFWGSGGSDYVGTTHVYNNTFYMGGTPDNGSPAVVKFNGSSFKNLRIRNNIFIAADGHYLVNAATAFDTSKVLFQGNCWHTMPGTAVKIKWGGTTHSSLTAFQGTGQEMLAGSACGMEADPLLTDPGNGGTIGNTAQLATLDAYVPGLISPVQNAGLDLSALFGIDPGARDFQGTAIPQNGILDIGAYELPAETGIRQNYIVPGKKSGVPESRYDILGRSDTPDGHGVIIRKKADGTLEPAVKLE